MHYLKESELILNSDGSIYHLNLLPIDISTTIITVGDPDRADLIASYFDQIEVEKHKREFKTITGTMKGKRLTVISTGIGTDNIDIVFNELDALVNIDLANRTVKEEKTKLNFIRIGTSGTIRSDVEIDSFILSKFAIGLEGLMHYYDYKKLDQDFHNFITEYFPSSPIRPYLTNCSARLYDIFSGPFFKDGITITADGFYGPQSREIRLNSKGKHIIDKLKFYSKDGLQTTNLEMETAGIYGLGTMLGHDCISLNAILANRKLGLFSSQPQKSIQQLIEHALAVIVEKI
jgi:uridine phosphorylase